MPKSAHFRMADRLAGGDLEGILTAYVGDGLSPESISSRLFSEYGIEATGMTVRRWLADLDGDDHTVAAS